MRFLFIILHLTQPYPNFDLVIYNHRQKNRPVDLQRVWWWSVGGSNRDAQPASLEKRGGRTPSFFHLITHLIWM